MKLRKNTIDETGKVYGNLTVLYPIRPENSRKIMWHCQCECGNTIDCYGSDLRLGRRTSCGNHCNSVKDEKNKIYGFLKILQKDDTPAINFPDHSVHWICECQLCGTIKSMSGRSLRNGTAQSCGCAESLGERYIAQILQELGFEYEKEYKFSDLVGDTGMPLRFDFYAHKNGIKFLIEFQGIQHFENIEQFRDAHATRLKNDKKKYDYVIKNNLNILYINQKNSRKFNGDYNAFKEVIINYYNNLKKGENGNERIFNYNY